jgi:conjugal transfer pilus assembly protein TraK
VIGAEPGDRRNWCRRSSLTGRPFALVGRRSARQLVCLGVLSLASPALADQNVMAADNGTVQCVASAKDLTRISLAGDQFASVSKITTGNPTEDFKIVNEPVRGDIYLSVPDGFPRAYAVVLRHDPQGLSSTSSSARCAALEAEQVFIANAAQ